MLRSRTFRLATTAVIALASGVGVALAAAPGQQTLGAITVTARDTMTLGFGAVGQDANVKPIAGEVDPDGPGPLPVQDVDILCPVDGVSDCELRSVFTFPKMPSGVAFTTHTMTSVVTSTVIDAATTTTSTATAAANVTGRPIPVGPDEPDRGHDFGEVPVGSTSAPAVFEITNHADADANLTVYEAGFGDETRQFALVENGCEGIAPGASCEVAIAFTPTRTGLTETQAVLRISGADEPPYLFLDGTGVAAPPTPATTVTQTQTVTTPPITIPSPGATVTLPARTVTVQGTPPPAAQCVVPNLKGRTLTSARRALTTARCALGTVRRPRGGGSLVVSTQTVRAGSKRTAGTKVGVRLVRKASAASRRR